MSNLIKNALVHGHVDKPVSVVIGSSNGCITMAVTNRGDALSAAVIPQLFKSFWRAAAGGAHEVMGLGLYIVLEIARAPGGHMDVASQSGVTTFSFSLPAG